jgi:5-formyltetrahydrofolate cyclo-ligase
VHGTGREGQEKGYSNPRSAAMPREADVPSTSGIEPLPDAAGGGGAGEFGAGEVGAGEFGAGEVGAGEVGGPAGAGAGGSGQAGGTKAAMRAELLAARRALTADQRAAAGHSLRDAVLAAPEAQMAGTVAAYLSVGTEPDTRGLVFALWKRGTYVLLPLLRPDGDLDWASYEGPDSVAAGPRGLLEPAEPPRGVTAITSADLIIVPALAADRRGVRLGRGGGSYDRALARVGPAILTIALLYDGELLEQLPAGPHDVPVRAAARPAEGITRLG